MHRVTGRMDKMQLRFRALTATERPRAGAAFALLEIGAQIALAMPNAEAVHALLRAAQKDPNLIVRRDATEALGHCLNARVLQALFASPNWQGRPAISRVSARSARRGSVNHASSSAIANSRSSVLLQAECLIKLGRYKHAIEVFRHLIKVDKPWEISSSYSNFRSVRLEFCLPFEETDVV